MQPVAEKPDPNCVCNDSWSDSTVDAMDKFAITYANL